MLKICRVNREGPIAPSRFAGYLAVFPSGAGVLTLISNGIPPSRTVALRNALTAVEMDRPSSSKMAWPPFWPPGRSGSSWPVCSTAWLHLPRISRCDHSTVSMRRLRSSSQCRAAGR